MGSDESQIEECGSDGEVGALHGPRSFRSPAPKLWNALPSFSRTSNSTLVKFKTQLKTILFSRAYGCHMRTVPP